MIFLDYCREFELLLDCDAGNLQRYAKIRKPEFFFFARLSQTSVIQTLISINWISGFLVRGFVVPSWGFFKWVLYWIHYYRSCFQLAVGCLGSHGIHKFLELVDLAVSRKGIFNLLVTINFVNGLLNWWLILQPSVANCSLMNH